MNLTDWVVLIGQQVGQSILRLANLIVADYWPGLLSLGFLIAGLIVGLIIWAKSRGSIFALDRAIRAVRESKSEHRKLDLAALAAKLKVVKGDPARRLEHAFNEFRETLFETGRGDDTTVRNSIRPSAFLNVDDLGFSLRGLRFVPGLFVSLGLFLTFLGLVAVLSSTADILPDGQGADQAETMTALRVLLSKASAKFTISLSALICSIGLNIWLKRRTYIVEKWADHLTHEVEKGLNFISLEGLAERQLRAIEDQTANMQELNTRLIAELSAPLKKVSESSMENISAMVGQLGNSLTSGIGSALDNVSEKIESVGTSLLSVSATLHEASQQFESSLKASTRTLDETVKRLEQVAEQMTVAGKIVGETTPSILETIKETNAHALKIAEGSTEMVNAVKTTIVEEKQIVTEALSVIRQLIQSFESRAVAYDGQLEKAFQTYQTEVARTVDQLESHGRGVQQRFADALSILQAVIENAKSFEPESIKPSAESDRVGEAAQ